MFDPVTTAAARVAGVEEELRVVVAALDPESVPLPAVPDLSASFDRIERLASAARTLPARRVEESGVWRREGHPSPAHYLARRSGTSVGQARNRLETSKRLTALPQTDQAVRQGKLSAVQADTIADAAAVNPAAESQLVEAAKKESLAELREGCARTKAAAEDAEETRRRIHARRHCERRTTAEGAGELYYRSTTDEVGLFWNVLEGFANAEFHRARLEGRREPHGAYLADAMLAMARAAADVAGPDSATNNGHNGNNGNNGNNGHNSDNRYKGDTEPGSVTAKPVVPTKVIARIDWEVLVRGWPLDGETCEVAGVGPVPVSVIRAMIESGDAFLAAVVTRGVEVVGVAHLGRRPTAHQTTALEWRDTACTVQGCHRITGLQVDHREGWAQTKITLLSLLDRLCKHHHDLKTRHGWKLVAGAGKRPMVPPGHVEHPDTRAPREEPQPRPP